jgi:hypothetical protein
MMEDEMKKIQEVAEALEARIFKEMSDLISHDRTLVVNVMINVGTSMLGKALAMVEAGSRDMVFSLMGKMIEQKANADVATFQTLEAVARAKNSTCRPMNWDKG